MADTVPEPADIGVPSVSHAPGTRTRRLMVPDIAWVEVPAGVFIYGEGKERETRRLDSFRMAKYPVTNAQYQCFIDDDGYADERWWRDLKRPEPEESQWSQANRPRTDVDWYEAVAFCRWFSSRLGLATDAVRLPTEREWEKAARGNDGRAYPWGDEIEKANANYYKSRDPFERPNTPGDTTPVGFYNGKAYGGFQTMNSPSPYGLYDMAGNVWQWMGDDYPKTHYRYLRGGSFMDYDYNLRSWTRNSAGPDYYSIAVGFRCAR